MEVSLPDHVWCEVFQYYTISPFDISNLKQVSQQFNHILNGANKFKYRLIEHISFNNLIRLNFLLILNRTSVMLEPKQSVYIKDPKVVQSGEKLIISSLKDKKDELMRCGKPISLKLGISGFHEVFPGNVFELLNFCKCDPLLWRMDAFVGHLYFYVNLHRLASLALQETDVIGIRNIIDNVIFHQKEKHSKMELSYNFDKCVKPMSSFTPQKQHSGFKDGIQLFKYQLDAVSWLIYVEQELENDRITLLRLLSWENEPEILFDTEKKKCIHVSHIKKYGIKSTMKGGILADEMGLGKTMEMIGLILANPYNDKNGALLTKPEKAARWQLKFEGEEPETRYVTNEEGMTEVKEIKAGKVPLKTLRTVFTQYHNKPPLFKSKATLVMCPNHLVKQWIQEIQKSAPDLYLLSFTTITDAKNTTYFDIIHADVVVASYEIFKNPKYLKIGKPNMRTEQYIMKEERSEIYLRTILQSEDGGLLAVKPMLENFEFHRIVLDEGHEIQDEVYQTIQLLQSRFKWYMSGTPFPSPVIRDRALYFLGFNTRDWWYFVKKELVVPGVVEDLVMLQFSDIERALYNLYDFWRTKTELCNSFTYISEFVSQFPQGFTLKSLRDHFIAKLKKEIGDLVKQIDDHRKKQKQHNVKLADAIKKSHAPTYKKLLENKVVAEDKSAEKAKSDLKQKMEFLAAFENSKPYNGPNLAAMSALQTINDDIVFPGNSKKKTKKKQVEQEPEPTTDEDKIKLRVKNLSFVNVRKELKEKGIKPKSNKYVREQLLTHLLETFSPSQSKTTTSSSASSPSSSSSSSSSTSTSISPSKGKNKKRPVEDDESGSDNTKRPRIEAKKEKKEKVQEKEEEKKIPTEEELKHFWIDSFGTKFAAVISYLVQLWKKSPTNRVIIFSQYDYMLEKIKDFLSTNGIKSVLVAGNIHHKSKAMTDFKSLDSNVRVILLSLKFAASGSNLIAATHVFLLDPITGTMRSEAQALEAQAIGRANRQGQTSQVTIVRFIIRDTVEHEHFIRNYFDEQKKAEEMIGFKQENAPTEAKPMMVRSSTIGNLLSNHQELGKSNSIMQLIE